MSVWVLILIWNLWKIYLKLARWQMANNWRVTKSNENNTVILPLPALWADTHSSWGAPREHIDLGPPGYLGGAPDPGCELTASTSPKNTEKRSKIILYNEYDESEWSSVMTNHDNSQSNINTSFPYSFSFHPLSGPTKHLPKITFFASFFISDSTVSRKMDHFDISFTSWKFSRSRQLTKPTLLDPVHLPGSPAHLPLLQDEDGTLLQFA